MNIQEFSDKANREAAEAQKTGLCVDCGLPAIPRCYSEDGRKEFAISGLCEVCFDDATTEVQEHFTDDDEVAF